MGPGRKGPWKENFNNQGPRKWSESRAAYQCVSGGPRGFAVGIAHDSRPDSPSGLYPSEFVNGTFYRLHLNQRGSASGKRETVKGYSERGVCSQSKGNPKTEWGVGESRLHLEIELSRPQHERQGRATSDKASFSSLNNSKSAFHNPPSCYTHR